MDLGSRVSGVWTKLKRLLGKEPEPPEDPYAYVGAPKKPRPPLRSTSAAEPLE